MKKIIFVLLSLSLFTNISFAQTKTSITKGYIQSVEVLKKYITQEIPRKEKVCEIKRVPVNEAAQGFGADNLIGALIGGAIGNKIGQGGGKQGSTAIGALIGSDAVRSHKQAHANNSNFVEKEICRIQRITHTETIEQISGYKLIIEVDGDLITVKSNKSYNPGDTISLKKEIRYNLF